MIVHSNSYRTILLHHANSCYMMINVKNLLTFPRILPKPWKYKAHKSPLALRCTPPCICSRWKCDPQEMSCNAGGEARRSAMICHSSSFSNQRPFKGERGTRPNCLHSHSVFCPVFFLLQAAATTFLQRMFRLKCPLPVQSESNVNCSSFAAISAVKYVLSSTKQL